MSISGLFLVLFLTLHLSINLTALISREAYESTWQFINSSIISQGIIPVLVLGFIIHIVYGIILAAHNRKISKEEDAEIKNNAKKSLIDMIALGVIAIGLLILHLNQFWTKTQLQGESPYDITKTLFYNGFYVAIYVIWIIALYFHLSRGFWNMFQSIATKDNKRIHYLQIASKVFSTIIAVGFILIPVYFYLDLGHA